MVRRFQENGARKRTEPDPKGSNLLLLTGGAYLIDKIVNVGFKDLIGVHQNDNGEQEKGSCWCDVNELCRRHPELRRSNVVLRKWRLDNGVPSKGGANAAKCTTNQT